ncbi:YHS domain-containing (seleno)protein [Reyranella sp.]|jgi:YHS domain-containing protein|uniref:YHS domain-containing (seleno)protein n=1 Tax=Reyranella sp. TaxID=1929291 RepID=UPI002F954AC5
MMRRRAVLAALPALPVGVTLSGNAFAQTGTTTGQRLALKGYDPVAYFTDGKPVQGADAYQLAWDGQRYLFASADHRDLFRQNPEKYAPQFGGACTMNLAAGRKREADPHNWIISDGKLYVFAGAAGPANFAKDPRNNAARAAENWQRLKVEAFQ